MDEVAGKRTCPECGSGDYTFRGRKRIEAVPEENEPEQTETKYKCKACEHEWKARMPV